MLKLLPEGICYVEGIGLKARIVNIVLTFILKFLPIGLQKSHNWCLGSVVSIIMAKYGSSYKIFLPMQI